MTELTQPIAMNDRHRTDVIAAVLGVAAIVVVTAALVQVVDDGLQRPVVALALAGGLVVSNLVPVVNVEAGRVSAFTPVGALLVPLGLLLGPAEAVVAYAAGETVGILASHRIHPAAGAPADRATARTVLTTSKSVLGAALAIVVMREIATDTSPAIDQIGAAFAGVAVSSLFDHVALALVARVVRAASVRAELVRDLGELALIGAAEAVVGAMIAILAARDPWSLVLGLTTFGLLLVAASSYARAEAEHDETRALLVLAGDLQHADDADEVHQRLLDCARRLFPDDQVAITSDSPGPHHRAWELPPAAGGPRWLVVERIASTRDYEEQPFDVIDAAVVLADGALRRVSSQERLVEQDRLRALVLSTVAHDLRSPLSSASGALRTLTRHLDRLSEDQSNDLRDLVVHSVDRAMRLVDDLVELQRDDEAVPATTVDVGEVVAELVDGIDIRPKVEITVTPTPPVVTNRVGIERAVENLVLNAAKFSPEGGTIRVTVEPADGGGVEVVVDDDGPGVPAEQRPRIFEAFEQAGSSRGGVGLGLYVAREFVRRAGGRIWAADGSTGGAAFHVWLPAE